ncbi:MAG: cytochrome c biogenesis protein CcsA [Rhizobacter sp.]|nr:cytochrome c biogenesis protein CcsA [Rhizobacter sp.]
MILSFGLSLDAGGAAGWMLPVASLLAGLGYAAAAALGDRQATLLRIAFVGGWLFHALAIVVDALGAGSATSGARFGFAPALSVTLWLVLAVYGVESRFVALPSARRVLAVLGAIAVALAFVYPGEFRPLATSRWAPLHWALGIASYGLFGVAVLHAVLLNRAERGMRGGSAATPGHGGLPLLRLERLTFRFVGVGFVVLTIALLLGLWFAKPWRWDHKTLLSILGWAVFAGLLLGRRLFGWRGLRATRWLYAGAALLLLAYVGSRFVLEVLLHRAPVS